MAKLILEDIATGKVYDYTKARAATEGMRVCVASPILEEQWNESQWRRCQRFLNDLLSKHPLPATEAKAAAMLAGFSVSTIRNAKEWTPHPIASQWVGNIGGGRWWWHCGGDTDATR